MSIVKKVYDLTNELIELFKKIGSDRDDKIVQLEAMLEEREQLLKAISSPYSDEEKRLGKELIELNETLSHLLTEEKMQIQKDLKDLTVKKESNNKYVNPYQNLSIDGMFYDKRK